MKNINFFSEEINFDIPRKNFLRAWVNKTVADYDKSITTINYIFCDDEFLLRINQQYLQHDTYTDIITFDQTTDPQTIEADIFISVPRVESNSKKFSVSFEDELHRVIIHGLLHLLGMSDKTEAEKINMRKKENHYLDLRSKI